MPGFSNILRGISGELELNRFVGFISGVGYSVGALGFTAWNMIEGRAFEIVEFCTSFGGGAAFITGGTAAAVAIKDRNVASSKVIEQTGAVPTKAKDGARVPRGDPPPVDNPPAKAKPTPDPDLPEYAR